MQILNTVSYTHLSLYIPVDQLGILQKYVGGDGVTPRLNKLSGSEWKQTKARAKQAVNDMADELILSLIHI